MDIAKYMRDFMGPLWRTLRCSAGFESIGRLKMEPPKRAAFFFLGQSQPGVLGTIRPTPRRGAGFSHERATSMGGGTVWIDSVFSPSHERSKARSRAGSSLRSFVCSRIGRIDFALFFATWRLCVRQSEKKLHQLYDADRQSRRRDTTESRRSVCRRPR